VSEWLLLNVKWAIFQAYQVIFWSNIEDVCFVIDQHTEFDFDSASSLQQHVYMLLPVE
jgi:hypothetical protein